MKAVVKTAPGDGHIEVLDIPEPEAGAGQVKITVRAAGICGTDLHIWHDEFKSTPPVVLGHEVSGEVAAVGDGVERVRPRGSCHDGDLLLHLRHLSLLPRRAYQSLPVSPLDRVRRQWRLHLVSDRPRA